MNCLTITQDITYDSDSSKTQSHTVRLYGYNYSVNDVTKLCHMTGAVLESIAIIAPELKPPFKTVWTRAGGAVCRDSAMLFPTMVRDMRNGGQIGEENQGNFVVWAKYTAS